MGLGYRVPAFCGALRRVLIAGVSDKQLESFFERLTPVRLTAYTIVDKAALREAIATTRAQDFALVCEEAAVGFRSIAIPVKDSRGRVIANINIGDNVERASFELMHGEYLKILRGRVIALAIDDLPIDVSPIDASDECGRNHTLETSTAYGGSASVVISAALASISSTACTSRPSQRFRTRASSTSPQPLRRCDGDRVSRQLS